MRSCDFASIRIHREEFQTSLEAAFQSPSLGALELCPHLSGEALRAGQRQEGVTSPPSSAQPHPGCLWGSHQRYQRSIPTSLSAFNGCFASSLFLDRPEHVSGTHLLPFYKAELYFGLLINIIYRLCLFSALGDSISPDTKGICLLGPVYTLRFLCSIPAPFWKESYTNTLMSCSVPPENTDNHLQ